jgi:predicted NUDIX family NTP pyrophosphohydrolase
MAKISAGILLYRKAPHGIEYLLVHPGGPYWAGKDIHAWSIPKGEADEAGKLEETARREFHEETGLQYDGVLSPLPPVRISGRKIIHAFLGEGDFDPASLRSNLFEMEWPPRSGTTQSFPEVDRAAWFEPDTARLRIHKGQVGIIDLADAFLK